MAGADLATLDAEAAEARCRQALNLDPKLGEAWYVLTVALFETRRVDETLAACRESLKRELTPAQRQRILGLETLLGRRRNAR
jgi:cytochrome c-type biogenesis protein CcmH/NrfG